jgi:hypothetical protein
MCSGVMGWLVLDSMEKKAASRTAAAVKEPMVVVSVQPS